MKGKRAQQQQKCSAKGIADCKACSSPVSDTMRRVRLVPGLVSQGGTVLFFCFFLYLIYKYVDPRAIAALNGLARYSFRFEMTATFFSELLSEPGNTALLLLGALMQVCARAWIGAAALTLTAVGLYAGAHALSRRWTGTALFPASLVPALIMLAACAHFELNLLTPLLSVCGSAFLALLWDRYAVHRALKKRIAAALVLLVVCYWLFEAGSGVFAVLIVIRESFRSRRSLLAQTVALGVTGLGICAGVALFSNLWACIDVDRLLLRHDRIMVLFYAWFPVQILAARGVCSLRKRLRQRLPAVDVSIKKKGPPANPQRPAKPVGTLWEIAGTGCTLVCLAAACWWVSGRLDPLSRDFGLRLHHTRAQQWDAVVAMGRPAGEGALATAGQHLFCHALYQTGALLERLADCHASSPGEALLLHQSVRRLDWAAWVAAIECRLNLGELALAERLAGEAFETMGPHGPFLWYRALIAAARGQTRLAQVYTARLAAVPVYRGAARVLDRGIRSGDFGVHAERIRQLRANRETVDYTLFSARPTEILTRLLQVNPDNRMALEYLTAYHLLNRNLPEFVALMQGAAPRFTAALPAVVTEALLLGASLGIPLSGSLSGWTADAQAVNRMERFRALYERNGNAPGMGAHLAAEWGGTYYHYYFYRRSGS